MDELTIKVRTKTGEIELVNVITKTYRTIDQGDNKGRNLLKFFSIYGETAYIIRWIGVHPGWGNYRKVEIYIFLNYPFTVTMDRPDQ
jgi:hypothetical protein